MPTYEQTRRFQRDYARLDHEQRARFKAALKKFIEDLEQRQGVFRKGLRVKPVEGTHGIYELTWDKDSDLGRATFMFGESVIKGQPHIIWRRCGTHEIFKEP